MRKHDVRNGVIAAHLVDSQRVARNARELLRNGRQFVVVRSEECAAPIQMVNQRVFLALFYSFLVSVLCSNFVGVHSEEHDFHIGNGTVCSFIYFFTLCNTPK